MRTLTTRRLLAGLTLACGLAAFPLGAAEKAPASKVPPGRKLAAGSWKKPARAIVFILVDEKTKTQTLVPESVYMWNGEKDVREIWWVYFHKDADVTFKEPLMPKPACEPSAFGTGGICKVQLPKAAKGSYPYSVTGHLANPSDPQHPIALKQVDPEVEIDR